MRTTMWWTSLPLVFLFMPSKALQGADLGSCIGICYCLCKGKIRQESGVGEEGSSDSEGKDEMPEVARTPCGRSRGTTKRNVSPTQQVDIPVVLSKDTHSMLSSPSSLSTCQGMRIAVRVRSMQLP